MSTTRAAVTVICDHCGCTLTTTRTTTAGARGDATRRGWRTAPYGDGYHSTKESADHTGRDLCAKCRPDKPKTDVGLFTNQPEEVRR